MMNIRQEKEVANETFKIRTSSQGNPRHSTDSGIMINSSIDAFNKVVLAVERKKGKLQELLLTEESYLENLEAVERILLEAKKAKKDDSMPKQLR